MDRPEIIHVVLKGIRPIMFDRYGGNNTTALPPEEKMYLNSTGELIIPSENIISFLCALNTDSAVKRFYDKRKYKDVARNILSFVTIEPFEIPLTREGNPIKWEGWNKNGITLHRSVARLDKGIPNPKERPVVDLPWQLEFDLTFWNTKIITTSEIKNLFVQGGIAIGLGTYRGVFGKNEIVTWEPKK